jgi:hypothetical protein
VFRKDALLIFNPERGCQEIAYAQCEFLISIHKDCKYSKVYTFYKENGMRPHFNLAQPKAFLPTNKIIKEGKVFPSTRPILKRILFQGVASALVIIPLTLFPLLTSAGEDPCRGTGIYIGNQTMLDVWYTRNGGPCTIWSHGHILIMKPGDILIIYSDMTCKREYCSKNPTYDVYESYDANRNCRVRILPDCTLSDM